MNTLFPEKIFLRRGEARAGLGLSDELFTKLVAAGTFQPVYMIWEVVDEQGMPLFTTDRSKAEAHVLAHPTHQLRPFGQAYYRRADLVKFAEENSGVPK